MQMATTQCLNMFDEGDNMLFDDADLFSIPCLAGELELQVQSYEGCGELPVVGEACHGKAFSLAKDSGDSSLNALADFDDADFMDNVSLDDIAAADHYGLLVCARQPAADSGAAADGSGCRVAPAVGWSPAPHQPGCASTTVAQPAQQLGTVFGAPAHHSPDYHSNGHESSDCDVSHHTAGDGESSGVGHGKHSSHSEESEDNTPGAPAACDEEHISPKASTFGGLSLMRLNYGQQQQQQPQEQQQQEQWGTDPLPNSTCSGYSQQFSQPFPAQPQQEQQAPKAQPSFVPRAFSVDNFALPNVGAVGYFACSSEASAPPPSAAGGEERRGQVYRTYSYVGPETLPLEFALGCDDSGLPVAFGARGRCASLNEVALRRQWLNDGELLAPQLPPSVDELELLELPEDTVPMGTRGSLVSSSQIQLQPLEQQRQPEPLAMPMPLAPLPMPLPMAMPPMKEEPEEEDDDEEEEEEEEAAPAPPPLPMPVPPHMTACDTSEPGIVQFRTTGPNGVVVTVKRKIITTPSPLLQQPRQRNRQPAAAAVRPHSSPKRVKIGSGSAMSAGGHDGWSEDGADGTSSVSGWHPPRPGAGGLSKARSMPANMNTYMDGVEVSVQPLGGGYGGSDAAASAGGSPAGSVCAPQPPARPACGAAAEAKKTGKRQQVYYPPPPPFIAPGMAFPEPSRRHNLVPSVPKPRKRASPNGNPPKAPAPNPNGHCCTQCGTQTTPVWRAGPHGPKTLCNACGVRYMKVAKGNVAPVPRRQQQHHH